MNRTSRRALLLSLLSAGVVFTTASAAAPTINRQWLLKSRPKGQVTLANFEYRERPVPVPKAGEALVRNIVFSLIPSQRMWMDETATEVYVPIALGDPVRSLVIAEVVKSENPRLPVGARISSSTGWEDYSIVRGGTPLAKDIDPIDAMSIYGINAMTGYFGMLRVGQPKAGETVVVSAAAGSVGSMAAQIARIKGCKVIGIAGGPVKCAWLMKECKLHAAIDYKNESVPQRLKALAPEGVNVYFDNVGGEMMQDIVDQMAVHGRVVICGQISAYDTGNPAPGPRDMTRIILNRLRIEGFSTGDFLRDREAALADLRQWKAEGLLVHKTDVRTGFKNLPATFFELFTGGNDGTLLLTPD